ncbi:MAG TPA: LacI family DNA-binding transcriptional regulator [Clostridia bacterium]|nr:LacI family DNA-binding transcriptional regulator [Clostridia bacterium]
MTIKDIASLAGVSHATVSRVLNDSPKVNPDTREKVLKLIQELEFSPRVSARALNSGKNYNIGLLILYDIFQSQFPTDFLPGILSGLTKRLNRAGYMLSLFLDPSDGSGDQAGLDALLNRNLDGVIILGLESNTRVAYRISRIHRPIVLLNHRFDDLPISSVMADDEQGAYLATQHLLDLGHRRIAFMEGNPRYDSSASRKKGFCRALSEAGLTPDPSLLCVGQYDETCAHEATQLLIQSGAAFSAMFASNDIMAVGVLQALRKARLRIPEDVSIVGFDDTQFATLLDPPLTTIRKPRTQLGENAAVRILAQIEAKSAVPVEHITLPNKLVVRASTQPYQPEKGGAS